MRAISNVCQPFFINIASHLEHGRIPTQKIVQHCVIKDTRSHSAQFELRTFIIPRCLTFHHRLQLVSRALHSCGILWHQKLWSFLCTQPFFGVFSSAWHPGLHCCQQSLRIAFGWLFLLGNPATIPFCQQCRPFPVSVCLYGALRAWMLCWRGSRCGSSRSWHRPIVLQDLFIIEGSKRRVFINNDLVVWDSTRYKSDGVKSSAHCKVKLDVVWHFFYSQLVFILLRDIRKEADDMGGSEILSTAAYNFQRFERSLKLVDIQHGIWRIQYITSIFVSQLGEIITQEIISNHFFDTLIQEPHLVPEVGCANVTEEHLHLVQGSKLLSDQSRRFILNLA